MTAQGWFAPVRFAVPGRRAHRLIERNLRAYRHTWLVIASGFVEPVLYLLGIGFGVGALVGSVNGVKYSVFVAPALMAASAMNGAVYETTFNLFFKLKYAKLYDAIISTPLGVADIALGEIGFALMRGAAYALAFILVMTSLGLVVSAWAVLAVPAAILISLAFAAVGTAATTFMRSWQDFDIAQLVLLPLFLFSATFYPLERYAVPMRVVVECTPLYHGVHLIRGLTTGDVTTALLLDAVYLILLATAGVAVAARRLDRVLRK